MDFANDAITASLLQSLFFWVFILVLVLGLSLGPRYIRSRERQRVYELMRVAYEKGQPVPPEVVAALTSEPRDDSRHRGSPAADSDLRRAVVLIAVGVGIAVLGLGLGWGIGVASSVGGSIVGGVIAGCGAVPGFIGVAYLLLWLAGRGHRTTSASPEEPKA
jgi:hypothetical protein